MGTLMMALGALPITAGNVVDVNWLFYPPRVSADHPATETYIGVGLASAYGTRTVSFFGIVNPVLVKPPQLRCAVGEGENRVDGVVHDFRWISQDVNPEAYTLIHGEEHPELTRRTRGIKNIMSPTDAMWFCTLPAAERKSIKAGDHVTLWAEELPQAPSNASTDGSNEAPQEPDREALTWTLRNIRVHECGHLLGGYASQPASSDARPRVTLLIGYRYGIDPLMHDLLLTYVAWYKSLGADRVVLVDTTCEDCGVGDPNIASQGIQKALSLANKLNGSFVYVRNLCSVEIQRRASLQYACQKLANHIIAAQLRIDRMSNAPHSWRHTRQAYLMNADQDELLMPAPWLAMSKGAPKMAHTIPTIARMLDEGLVEVSSAWPGARSNSKMLSKDGIFDGAIRGGQSCYHIFSESYFEPYCRFPPFNGSEPPREPYVPSIMRRPYRATLHSPADEAAKPALALEHNYPGVPYTKWISAVVHEPVQSLGGLALPIWHGSSVHMCPRVTNLGWINADAFVFRHLRKDRGQHCLEENHGDDRHRLVPSLDILHIAMPVDLGPSGKRPEDTMVLKEDAIPNDWAASFVAQRKALATLA